MPIARGDVHLQVPTWLKFSCNAIIGRDTFRPKVAEHLLVRAHKGWRIRSK